ncbi:unnamed protein product [Thlaspi arvense]|uniref:Ycf15 n=1 Tax=Thlaspi arvense TaxID=13288 RepID=A0AAU9RBA2_THLAR|nr:unnamed protein product [Thlaspi arvense]
MLKPKPHFPIFVHGRQSQLGGEGGLLRVQREQSSRFDRR